MATIESGKVYKKRNKSRKRSKTKFRVNKQFKYFSYLLLSFILGLTIIYNYAIITQTRMEIDEINKEIDLLSKEKEDILVMIESAKNTGLIEKNAMNFLGMDYPDINQRSFIEVSYNDDIQEVAVDNYNQKFFDNIFIKTFSLITDNEI